MEWYYADEGGKAVGPISEQELRDLSYRGAIRAGTLVWRDGMDDWQPYSEALADGALPVLPPATGAAAPPELPVVSAERNGPAWEQREQRGFFAGAIQTVQDVLLAPALTFSRMKREGGLLNPYLFFLLTAVLGVAAASIYQLILRVARGELRDEQIAPEALRSLLVFMPLVVLLAPFFTAGIYHLFLFIFGGNRQPFETTFRVVCYGHGAAVLLQIVPLCGSLAYLVLAIVASIIGLAQSHEITTGRSAAAVILPTLACCACVTWLNMAALQ